MNKYFYGHLINNLGDKLLDIIDEKLTKYIEIYKGYNSQIKEMEFIMDEDRQHKESVYLIINSLKEEMENELSNLDDHYNKNLEDTILDFKKFGIRNNLGVQLLDEKFKLEIVKLINLLLSNQHNLK